MSVFDVQSGKEGKSTVVVSSLTHQFSSDLTVRLIDPRPRTVESRELIAECSRKAVHSSTGLSELQVIGFCHL